MPAYRFEVLDLTSGKPAVVDEWSMEQDDDEAAWTVTAMVTLSGRQQVLVYRPGEAVAFGSKASDELADAMEQQQ